MATTVLDTSDQVINLIATASPLGDQGWFGPPPSGFVEDTITHGWHQAQSYALTAFTTAQDAMKELEKVADDLAKIPPVDPNLANIPAPNPPTFQVVPQTITMPTIQPPNTADFENLLSQRPTLVNPTIPFVDSNFSSPLLTSLIATLQSWVSGASTGIAPNVEAAIWERGRARELVSVRKKTSEAIRQFAARGFVKPPGVLSLELASIEQDFQDVNISSSREVMIKQADLEQSNRRFAMELAWKVEQGLINYLNEQMQRSLAMLTDTAKLVSAMNAQLVQLYTADVQAFTGRNSIEGQRYTADVQLATEAARLAMTVSKSNADAVQSAQASRDQMEASRYKSDVDFQQAIGNLRVEISRANVQAMIQQTQALIASLESLAKVSAQLAAAALSSINLSAGASSSASWGANSTQTVQNNTNLTAGTNTQIQEQITD